MATSEIEQLWISQFQENLGALRKVAGWTTQQLANELGVARQTISNLETGRSPMTKLQYLALRTVFSAEIAECGNRELAKIIKALVDEHGHAGTCRHHRGSGPRHRRRRSHLSAVSQRQARQKRQTLTERTALQTATRPIIDSRTDSA